jgi:alpha-N-acetylglucosaminidase
MPACTTPRRGPCQSVSPGLVGIPILLAVFLLGGAASLRAEPNSQAAEAVLKRMLPDLYSQLSLRIASSSDGGDFFRISGERGHIIVEGNNDSALLYGVNWYLKYVAHLQISTNGNNLRCQGLLPAPGSVIRIESPYRFRYALNQNNDGYTTPYWGWPRWQQEIDLLALSGINTLLIERGTDAVLYETFREFGYSDQEVRQWITQPAHQNWQLMGNLCCFDEPISRELLEKRAHSARQVIARLRALGITPVLPGYYGIVPASFRQKHPEANVIAQGDWNGFARPGWLDPRDPLFARVAATFYRKQRELFGDTTIYDMEMFQEGGAAGTVPVGEAAQRVQAALEAAHPNAYWMLLGWQANPPAELLEHVNRRHLLIVDIEQGRNPDNHRDQVQPTFSGAFGTSAAGPRWGPTCMTMQSAYPSWVRRPASRQGLQCSLRAWTIVPTFSTCSQRWRGIPSRSTSPPGRRNTPLAAMEQTIPMGNVPGRSC